MNILFSEVYICEYDKILKGEWNFYQASPKIWVGVRKRVRFAMLIANHFTKLVSGKVNIYWEFQYGKHYCQT